MLCFQSKATHIIGGFLEYKCVGQLQNDSATYRVNLHLYVDCGPSSTPINELAPLSVFDTNLIERLTIEMPRIQTQTISDGNFNPCVVNDTSLCAFEEVYTSLIVVASNQDHIITYQRCCRNNIIDNLLFPESQGVTYTLRIPAYDQIGCNTTPEFQSIPPISFCANYDLNEQLTAVDLDGDSLVYSLCSPLNYSSQLNPRPIPANSPPYSNVTFLSPYTAQNPMLANPPIAINPQNGILSGSPTQVGQFVVGFCVSEYRNGVLLSTSRRDVQMNIERCDPIITTAVQDQEQFCDGYSVRFRNLSFSNEVDTLLYFWNFGDLTTQGDTSRQKEPLYTYPDTGSYTITLITNPGYPCSDTSTEVYRVYPILAPDIAFSGKLCRNGSAINLFPSGEYESYADFEWNFNDTTLPSMNQDSIFNLSTDIDALEAQLIVSQNGCSDTVQRSIELFPNPTADFSFDPIAGCYPLDVNFTNQSTTNGAADFRWSFGDGNTSTLDNPSHTYLANGFFNVELVVQTTEKCIDTVQLNLDSAVHVSLDSSKNLIDFEFAPNTGCPPLQVDFIDRSTHEGAVDLFWNFGDGNLGQDSLATNTYTRTGYYDLGLMMIAKEKCVDTLVKTIDSAIHVLEAPSALLLVSDTSLSIKAPNFQFDGRAAQNYSQSFFIIEDQIIDGLIVDYTFEDTGTYVVKQVLINSLGCTDTALVNVYVYDVFEVIIPNVFTPNGDGINDRFEPKAIGVYDYKLKVFNRYGEMVFQSNNLGLQWDGRIRGKKAQSGVYFYQIQMVDFESKKHEYRGSLTLLKD
jgi:gliding motility-associated-like protein